MRHLYIPDPQIRKGSALKPLVWAYRYATEKRPERIICAGDYADNPSLSSYDKGTRKGEGRRLREDIDAVRLALEVTEGYLPADYHPDKHLTYGNHEERLLRHIEANPELHTLLDLSCYGFEDYGWTTHDFLQPVELDGIRYCHYFTRSANGKVVQSKRGMPNAETQVKREMMSCTAGHSQGLSVHIQQLQDRRFWGIIAGSYHPLQHEGYIGPQGQAHWNGIILKNGVENGDYSPIFISADYLCRRYEGVSLEEFARDATDLERMTVSV